MCSDEKTEIKNCENAQKGIYFRMCHFFQNESGYPKC